MSRTRFAAGAVSETERIDPADHQRILAHERRRVVLSVLEEKGTPIDLEELTESVIELELETETKRRVMLTLHHRHLPMMAERDVIEYDPETRQIRAVTTVSGQ